MAKHSKPVQFTVLFCLISVTCGTFTCPPVFGDVQVNATEISSDLVCDGNLDCIGGEDELNCPTVPPQIIVISLRATDQGIFPCAVPSGEQAAWEDEANKDLYTFSGGIARDTLYKRSNSKYNDYSITSNDATQFDLVIQSINVEDAGTIRCYAIISGRLIQSYVIRVEVQTDPVRVTCDEPCKLTNLSIGVEEGKRCDCSCEATGGYPDDLNLAWTSLALIQDSQNVASNLGRFDFQRTAHITNTSRNVPRGVTCSIEGYNVYSINRDPYIEKALTLEVQVKPAAVDITCDEASCNVADSSIIVEEGKKCDCTCIATGVHPHTLKLSWIGLIADQESRTTWEIQDDGLVDLKRKVPILATVKHDATNFECLVSGYTVSSISNSPDIKKSLTMQVEIKPSFQPTIHCSKPCEVDTSSITVTIPNGHFCKCTCKSTGGYPSTLQLEWYNITDQQQYTTFTPTGPNGTFDFQSNANISWEDIGLIGCRVSGYNLLSISESSDIWIELLLVVNSGCCQHICYLLIGILLASVSVWAFVIICYAIICCNTKNKKIKFFISFCLTHEERVIEIKDEIEKNFGKGSCWMSTTNRLGGDNLDAENIKAIDEAMIVLCMISDDYADSIQCEEEVLFARQKNKYMIPIMIGEVDWPLKKGDGTLKKGDGTSPMQPAFDQQEYVNLATEITRKAYDDLISKIRKIVLLYKNRKFFISFCLTHEERVIEIKDEIETHFGKGSCWMSTTNRLGGVNLDAENIKSINEAMIVLCMISVNYADSIQCARERLFAQRKDKPIIMVIIDEMDCLPKKSDVCPRPEYVNLAAGNRRKALDDLISKMKNMCSQKYAVLKWITCVILLIITYQIMIFLVGCKATYKKITCTCVNWRLSSNAKAGVTVLSLVYFSNIVVTTCVVCIYDPPLFPIIFGCIAANLCALCCIIEICCCDDLENHTTMSSQYTKPVCCRILDSLKKYDKIPQTFDATKAAVAGVTTTMVIIILVISITAGTEHQGLPGAYWLGIALSITTVIIQNKIMVYLYISNDQKWRENCPSDTSDDDNVHDNEGGSWINDGTTLHVLETGVA